MTSHTNLQPIPANESAAPAARSVRILLVDDNQDTLKFLSTILHRQGHQVLTAPDLSSSLRMASEAEFDLIISDIELPDGSGLELMRVVRSRRAVPGIALSGYSSPEDIAQSRAAGFALHLTKPVDFRRLEQAIEELAARAPAESPINP
jgi:CheY-like chemotaxis protein